MVRLHTQFYPRTLNPFNMAPSALDTKPNDASHVVVKTASPSAKSKLPGPLQYAGTLDQYESFDLTSVIGHEFPHLQLVEVLRDDDKMRDLALIGARKRV